MFEPENMCFTDSLALFVVITGHPCIYIFSPAEPPGLAIINQELLFIPYLSFHSAHLSERVQVFFLREKNEYEVLF